MGCHSSEQPFFCLSRRYLTIVDLMYPIEADRSLLSIAPIMTTHFWLLSGDCCKTLEMHEFQIVQALATKFCFEISRLNIGGVKSNCRFEKVLYEKREYIDIGVWFFKILKVSIKMFLKYRFCIARKPFSLNNCLVCSST